MRQTYNSDASPCSPPPSPPESERRGDDSNAHTCIPGCNQARLSLSQLIPSRLLSSRMLVSHSVGCKAAPWLRPHFYEYDMSSCQYLGKCHKWRDKPWLLKEKKPHFRRSVFRNILLLLWLDPSSVACLMEITSSATYSRGSNLYLRFSLQWLSLFIILKECQSFL